MMPFSPSNRRLTILSIVTLTLLGVALYLLLFVSQSPRQDRVLNSTLVILGIAALWWKSEFEGRKTREPIKAAAVNSEAAAQEASQAVTVTQETYEKLQAELKLIKTTLNGDLDRRIVQTVTTIVDERLPVAVEKVLEEKLEPAIERICRKFRDEDTPRVQT
jgi:uncharacterized FlaG/YvyC family protein